MPLFSRAKNVPEPAAVEPVPQPAAASAPDYLPGAPDTDPNGLRGIDEHRDYLLSFVNELRPFGIGLIEANGLTLCESLTSDLDLPIFTAATVDGWAVRASNLVGASQQHPVVLPIVGAVAAGEPRGLPLAAGTTVRVAAGAPVPEGADAVLTLDDGIAGTDAVEFRLEARPQQNLRLAGSRVADGDRLLDRGGVLTPRALGLIAEVGNDKVLARPRPRVVVVTAGTGLVEPGRPLTTLTQRYDATTTLLAASLRDDGAQVFVSGLIAPDPQLVATMVNEQLVRADMVILVADLTPALMSGMVGMGTFDIASVDGFVSPLGFGVIGPDRTPLLVLPLRPVPAYLAYELFGRSLVERLGGQEITDPELIDAHLVTAIESHPVLTQLVLAHCADDAVRPLPFVGDQGSAELCDANAVALIPAGVGVLPAGSGVVCWILD